jgi:hypothetical protein
MQSEIFIKEIVKGNLAEVKRLVAAGCDKNRLNYNIVKFCAIYGHVDIMKYLISIGYRPQIKIQNKDYSLKWAAMNGHLELVKYLILDEHCDYALNHNYAFRYAAGNGHLEVIKYLSTLVKCDHRSNSDHALRLAASNGHVDAVDFLITMGCDVRSLDFAAVKNALKNERFDVIKYFATTCESISTRFMMSLCCVEYCTGSLKYLVSLGFDFRFDKDELLGLSFNMYRTQSVRCLLSLGCNLMNCIKYHSGMASFPGYSWYTIKRDIFGHLARKDISYCIQKYPTNTIFLEKLFWEDKKNIVRKMNQKYNQWKFILKPTSLHTQLMVIE